MNIFDFTPNCGMDRPLEIYNWLHNTYDTYFISNGKVNYVILDDDFSYNDYKKYALQDHLVKTNFYEDGLTKIHLQKAIRIMNGDLYGLC